MLIKNKTTNILFKLQISWLCICNDERFHHANGCKPKLRGLPAIKYEKIITLRIKGQLEKLDGNRVYGFIVDKRQQ